MKNRSGQVYRRNVEYNKDYCTKRNIELKREYQLYATSIKRDRYEWTKDVGCQCGRSNLIRYFPREEVKYYNSPPNQVYTYTRVRSYTNVGVGNVMMQHKKRIRKIYLPETEHRAVGSSGLFPLASDRKPKIERENIYYCHKGTSAKRVVEAVENVKQCTEKLSPIIFHNNSKGSSPNEMQEEKRISKDIGNNTINKNITNTTTQVDNVNVVQNNQVSSKQMPKDSKIVEGKEIEKIKSNRSPTKKFQEIKTILQKSSDSLEQHVHNLEDPSFIPSTGSSDPDPMENKLEKEYRKIFSTKDKHHKVITEKPEHDLKSTSLLRRRFEALKRGIVKKDDSKKNSRESNPAQGNDAPSHRDISVESDPPSLEARSYSRTKIFSPPPSMHKHNRRSTYPSPKKSNTDKKDKVSINWSPKEHKKDDANVKGLFKMWEDNFNFEEQTKCPPPSLSIEKKAMVPEKNIKDSEHKPESQDKKGKRFLFFKKRSKDKTKTPSNKKGITTGRCEVKNCLMLSGQSQSKYPQEGPKVEQTKIDSDDILKKNWLQKFIQRTIESRKSLQIRWNNKTYATSSSTVFELMDNVYRQTQVGFVVRSQSETSTIASSYYQSQHKHHVNFVQDIEAWMIPNLITERDTYDYFPKDRNGVPDHKWFINKSKAFAHKIELVLHSKNFANCHRIVSSEYLRIDIPKGFFTDHSSESDRFVTSNSEEVYKIVEYESPESRSQLRLRVKNKIGDSHNDVKIPNKVSVRDKNTDPRVIETVIKKPPDYRDVIIQGSKVNIPKRCDVVGVGIITHRVNREIEKSMIKTDDDDSEEESGQMQETTIKQCQFAESYLREYYRNWMPLGIDLFPSSASDKLVKCESEESLPSLNNQGDGSKSCPNISNDYHSFVNLASCNSQCSFKDKQVDKTRVFNTFKSMTTSETPVDTRRILPKDSFEVLRKRMLYACGNKSKWNYPEDRPFCVPSIQDKAEQDALNITCNPQDKTRKLCKKRVSITNCDYPPESTCIQSIPYQHSSDIKTPPGILSFNSKTKASAYSKHAIVKEDNNCDILPPACKEFCISDTIGSKAPCDKTSSTTSPISKKSQKQTSRLGSTKSPPILPSMSPENMIKPKIPPCLTNLCPCPQSLPKIPQQQNLCTCLSKNKKDKKSSKHCPSKKKLCSSHGSPCSNNSSTQTAGSQSPCSCIECLKKGFSPSFGNLPDPASQRSISSQTSGSINGVPFSQVPKRSSPLSNKSFSSLPRESCSPTTIIIIPRSPQSTKSRSPPPVNPRRSQPVDACSPPHSKPMSQPVDACSPPHSKPMSPSGKSCISPPANQRSPLCSKPCSPIPANPTPLSPTRSRSPPSVRPCSTPPAPRSPSQTSNSSLCNLNKTAESVPKIQGLHLKMKPAPKCPKQCPSSPEQKKKKKKSKKEMQKVCNEECLTSVSDEKIMIRVREETASTEEIRENLNIKVKDADGRTLYERRDYKADERETSSRPSVLGEMYKINRMSTTSIDKLPQKEDKQKNKKSVENLIEISFGLKVTQGDKVTEINVSGEKDEDDKPEINCNNVKSQDVLLMQSEIDPALDDQNDKNDINIKIIIKNFRSKPEKIDNTHNNSLEFSKKISQKFNTVSTGYSDIIPDQIDNMYSIHRTTIDLTTSKSDPLPDSLENAKKNEFIMENIQPNKISREVLLNAVVTDCEIPATETSERSHETKQEVNENKSKSGTMQNNVTYEILNKPKSSEQTFENNIQILPTKSQPNFLKTDEYDLKKSETCEINSPESPDKPKVYESIEKSVTIERKSDTSEKILNNTKLINNNETKANERDESCVTVFENNKSERSDKTNSFENMTNHLTAEMRPGTDDSTENNKIVIDNTKVKENVTYNNNNTLICETVERKSEISLRSHKTGNDVIIYENNNKIKTIEPHELQNEIGESIRNSNHDNNTAVSEMGKGKPQQKIETHKIIHSETGEVILKINSNNDIPITDPMIKTPEFAYTDDKSNKSTVSDKRKSGACKFDDEIKEYPDSFQNLSETVRDIEPVSENETTDFNIDSQYVENSNKSETVFSSLDTSDQDNKIDLITTTSDDCDNACKSKPRSKREKKEMLKHVFEKAANPKWKSKGRMKRLKNMLKFILTSDSSEIDDEVPSNGKELIEDVTYSNFNPPCCKDTDSMNNYYQIKSVMPSDDESKTFACCPTQNQSEDSYYQTQDSKCVCSTIADKINKGGHVLVPGCCCKSIPKIHEQTSCNINNDKDLCIFNYKSQCIDVHTQHSIINSRITNVQLLNKMESVMTSMKSSDFEALKINHSVSPYNSIKECEAKNVNTNMLGLLDNGKIVIRSNDPDKVSLQTEIVIDWKGANKEKQKEFNNVCLACPADILQSYETKKAVLEIYTKKTITEEGERLVAKLPRFVYDKEREIEKNYVKNVLLSQDPS